MIPFVKVRHEACKDPELRICQRLGEPAFNTNQLLATHAAEVKI